MREQSSVTANLLYYGDNLDVLRRHIKDDSVDLVYLDPPFNSSRNYNVLFASREGTQAAAQIRAFEDTWQWDQAAARQFEEIVERGGKVSETLQAFRLIVGTNDMLAYLTMMAPRLVELHRVMKDSGSLYLHCDQTASHYLKLLLDSVFGPERFRSEITWKRTSAHSDARRNWGAVADSILYYTKGESPIWNPQFLPHSAEYADDKYRHRESDGRRYTLDNMTSPNPRPNMMYEWKGHASPPSGWRYARETMEALDAEGRIWYPDDKSKRPRFKRYLDEMPGLGTPDVWTDIPPINSQAKERLGYPTQKPEALLERIIRTSSNPGDTVLDPFCGCGTTVAAAQRLGRKWVGIDITHLAISLIKSRLKSAFGEELQLRVIGEPTTVDDAQELAKTDPYQFQWWALGLVDARGAEKKGADQGIDGRLYFHAGDDKTRSIIISVKAGKFQPTHVRDLQGVMQREKAEIGVLISFAEPTKPMRQEAASAGFYESPWGKHPRVQLLTVGDILAGKQIDYPKTAGSNVTLKQAPRARVRETAEQLTLD